MYAWPCSPTSFTQKKTSRGTLPIHGTTVTVHDAHSKAQPKEVKGAAHAVHFDRLSKSLPLNGEVWVSFDDVAIRDKWVVLLQKAGARVINQSVQPEPAAGPVEQVQEVPKEKEKVEEKIEEKIEEKAELDKRFVDAAVTIQFGYRAHLDRKRYKKQKASVIKIQAMWRGYFYRKKAKKRHQQIVTLQAFCRRWAALKQYRELVRHAQHRRISVEELLTTERNYVGHLATLVELFLTPLEEADRPILKPEKIASIFGNIRDVLAVNQQLLVDLEERIGKWHTTQCVGDLFTTLFTLDSASFATYSTYVNNYNEAILSLRSAKKKSSSFRDFLEKANQDPRCPAQVSRYELQSFLILPIQRLPRYEMVLKDLLRHTWSTHPDFAALEEAVSRVVQTLVGINESKRDSENVAKVAKVAQKIVHRSEPVQQSHPQQSVAAPGRRYVFEGMVQEVVSTFIQEEEAKRLKQLRHVSSPPVSSPSSSEDGRDSPIRRGIDPQRSKRISAPRIGGAAIKSAFSQAAAWKPTLSPVPTPTLMERESDELTMGPHSDLGLPLNAFIETELEDRYIFLFNDCFMYTKRFTKRQLSKMLNTTFRFNMLETVPLLECQLEDLTFDEPQDGIPPHSFLIMRMDSFTGKPKRSFVFACESHVVKTEWLRLIQTTIDEARTSVMSSGSGASADSDPVMPSLQYEEEYKDEEDDDDAGEIVLPPPPPQMD